MSDGKPRPNGLPKNDAFTKLYFKWGKNPSESFDAPAFMTHSFGIRAARNCEFENIAITGFGAHGVALAWNCKFRNLDIDLETTRFTSTKIRTCISSRTRERKSPRAATPTSRR